MRKFPGNFDYYLEKRDTEVIELPRKDKIISPADIEKARIREAREKARQEEKLRKEELQKRKAHNKVIHSRIDKLKKEKEDLHLESYAKARALSDPHIYRDEDTARDYGRRLKEIEKLLIQIDFEIKKLEEGLI